MQREEVTRRLSRALCPPSPYCFPGSTAIKNRLPAQEMQEMEVQSLGWEDILEEEMATRSSILAWRIPWTEEPCGL